MSWNSYFISILILQYTIRQDRIAEELQTSIFCRNINSLILRAVLDLYVFQQAGQWMKALLNECFSFFRGIFVYKD